MPDVDPVIPQGFNTDHVAVAAFSLVTELIEVLNTRGLLTDDGKNEIFSSAELHNAVMNTDFNKKVSELITSARVKR